MLLALLMLGHAGGQFELRPIVQLDAWLHDVRLRLFAPGRPEDRVAVVAIDEPSLAALGRWPWSRARIADLVEVLFEREGVALLGLDLILAEPDDSSGLAALDAMARGPLRDDARFQTALAERRADLDHDGRLAAVLQAHPVVLGFHLSRGPSSARVGTLPAALSIGSALPGLTAFDGFGGNLARLQAAAGGGFLNADVDPDGVRRRAPLLARLDEGIHASLALAMARRALGRETLVSVASSTAAGTGPEWLRLQSADRAITVPIGTAARVLLPYPARSGLAPVYSANAVLTGALPAGALRGRLVLLGATAPGLADLHATPVAENLPGVLAHASLLSALLEERVPRVPAWAPGWEATMVVVVALAALLMGRLDLRGATLVAAGSAVLLVAGNFAFWAIAHEGLPLAGPLAMLAALFAWQVFVGHVLESRDRRRLAALFGQYVPPELVERMASDPARFGMQGRSAHLTVMFADLRGFTALSETLPPADLAALMNEFLSAMTDIVRDHGGTLDKYVGDALMAFWGAPMADPDHARHAAEAALAMQAALPALNRQFAARGWPPLTLGIGINSGTMVVGDLGSRHRRAYTVLGDAVNVAARLQELSAQSPNGIVIGQSTRQLLSDWPCREIDTVVLRGRRTPETLFVPVPCPAGAPGDGNSTSC